MIYKIHDKDDKVIAYVVYFQIDKNKTIDENGAYIYVEDVWVHKSIRFKDTMNKMLYGLLPLYNNKYIYWQRCKYNDRISLYEVMRGERIKLIKKEI
jgi:hypothetical protein